MGLDSPVFGGFGIIISKIASSEFSGFSVSVAEEIGLSLALSETPKTGFGVWRSR